MIPAHAFKTMSLAQLIEELKVIKIQYNYAKKLASLGTISLKDAFRYMQTAAMVEYAKTLPYIDTTSK